MAGGGGAKIERESAFQERLGFDGGSPRYEAIINDQTQVSDAFSTWPAVREETLARYSELGGALNSLAGKLDDEGMRKIRVRWRWSFCGGIGVME